MNKREFENALCDYRINEIKRQRELLDYAGSNLTAKYGIEAAMPKAKEAISDPMALKVIRRDKNNKWKQKIEKKVLFIQ